jgi:hypothetical protein
MFCEVITFQVIEPGQGIGQSKGSGIVALFQIACVAGGFIEEMLDN